MAIARPLRYVQKRKFRRGSAGANELVDALDADELIEGIKDAIAAIDVALAR